MTKRIPDEYIKLLKKETDIIELASEYFELRKMGNLYQTNCIHGDKDTPSLTFFPDSQTFYCFGCGAGKKGTTNSSDVFAFVSWVDNCSWTEAIEKLSARKGMVIPKKDLSPEEQKRVRLYEECLATNRLYWQKLQDHTEYIQYFNSRGIGEEEINKWRLGFVGHDDATKVASRVVFPIMNDWGQTVAFSYRNMEDVFPNIREAEKDRGPKYYNSPKSPIFDKGSIFYGLNFVKKEIREKGYVIIGEGFGDAILGQKYGLPFVSIMGTSLTDNHIQIIKRYTDNVIMWQDGDAGGLSSTLRSLDPLRAEGIQVSIINVAGKDPDDIFMEYKENSEEFVMQHKRLAGQFELDLVLDKYRSTKSELVFKTIQETKELFKRMKNPTEIEVYAAQASQDLGITKELFLENLQ